MIASAPFDLPASVSLGVWTVSLISLGLLYFVFRTEREIRLKAAAFAVLLVMLSVSLSADTLSMCEICARNADSWLWYLYSCWLC